MKVKIVNKSSHPSPHYATSGSSGLDIRADIIEPIHLAPMERRLIPTGIFIALPIGYEAQVRPRSGLALKQGITCLNSPGTVDADNSDTYTVNISVLKDSLMYIRILGSFLGIKQEGMQVKVKRDSVFLYKKIGERYVQNRSISFLQEVTQIPFDFTTLQDLIIGNPVFIDSNIVSYKDNDAGLLVLMLGDTFKHLITLAQDDKTIIHSKLDDVDFQRNRTCDITYSSYAPLGSYQFSTYRRVVVSEKSKLDLELDFKEYTINEPLKYTFEIPKNVKRK